MCLINCLRLRCFISEAAKRREGTAISPRRDSEWQLLKKTGSKRRRVTSFAVMAGIFNKAVTRTRGSFLFFSSPLPLSSPPPPLCESLCRCIRKPAYGAPGTAQNKYDAAKWLILKYELCRYQFERRRARGSETAVDGQEIYSISLARGSRLLRDARCNVTLVAPPPLPPRDQREKEIKRRKYLSLVNERSRRSIRLLLFFLFLKICWSTLVQLRLFVRA